MYEDQTYEEILNRALGNARSDLDKTEGSVLFTALAPACIEFALHYLEMDGIITESYADTCSRDYLILRCNERGITPYEATAAVLKGEFNVDIGVGARFSLDDLNYVSIAYIGREDDENESGLYYYQMQCETVGTDGNNNFGELTAIEYITNLTTANLTEVLIPGEDEEDTEDLRARYYESFETDPFGGNQKDYIEKTNALNGVGATKVVAAWNGGGTVKLIIIDSEYNAASDALVDYVQEEIDPLDSQGTGAGIAPIGHTVTVVSAAERYIKITFSLVYNEGYSWDTVGTEVLEALEEYMLEMRKDWANQSYLTVRITQIESRILTIEGIFDVSGTQINGAAENLALESDEIPILNEESGVVESA